MKTVLVETEARAANLQYTALLANALARSMQVTVVVPPNVAREYFEPPVKLLPLPMGNTMRNFAISTLLFPRWLRFISSVHEEKPDIVHLREPFQSWVTLALPLLGRYPLVTSFFEVEPHIGRWDKFFSRRICLRYSLSFTVVSQIEKQLFHGLGVDKPCFVIPEGVNTYFTRFQRDGIQEREEVLFFGGFEERKGLQHLIEAAPLVAERVPRARVVIAGQGSLEKHHLALGRASNVEIINDFLSAEQVAELFQRARVVVLPYLIAVASGVLPVAWAFGKAVVVTRVGSFPEIIEEGRTGLLVPPGDSRALAEAIIRLLSDKELRQQIGKNAYAKAQRDHSWESIAEKTIQVYHVALEGN